MQIFVIIALAAMFFLKTLESESEPENSKVTTSQEQVSAEGKSLKADRKVEVRVSKVDWPEKKKPDKKHEISPAKVKKNKTPPPKTKKQQSRQKSSDSTSGKSSGSGNGVFNLIAEFECSMDFYIKAMEERGAKVVLYEGLSENFYQLDSAGVGVRLVTIPYGYSSVTRRLTDDYPDAKYLLQVAEGLWGAGAWEILLLLPLDLEQSMNEKLTDLAAAVSAGIFDEITSFSISYKKQGAELAMFVKSFNTSTSSVSINREIKL